MGGGGNATRCPFRRELERWRAVGGGIDENGRIVTEPWQLTKARMIDTMCQRYSCLPSALLAEDVDLIIQMHAILALAGDFDSAERPEPPSMNESLANLSRSI